LQGFEHLAELASLSAAGNACLLCMNHISNLDVPTLRALVEDQADPAVFDRIVWISGRKLHEDCGLTPMLAESFQQIVVTPRSWLREARTAEERSNACRMNMRAYRTMRRLRRKGWIIGLFPAGTRRRPNDERTAQAVDETDSYLKYADYVVLGRVEGCTLPVTRDRDMSRETPCCDRVVYAFGPVCRTADWRARAASRYPALTQRAASALAIMVEIDAIAESAPSADPVAKANAKLCLSPERQSLPAPQAAWGASASPGAAPRRRPGKR
jgi:hypothetical protein